MRVHTRTLVLILFVIVGIIVFSRLRSAAGEPKAPERFEHDMMVRYHMHENYGVARAIEQLVVHGKLGEAAFLARSIADAPDEPGLEPFAARATAVREAAGSLANAPNLDEACRRQARLAAACAGCHLAAGVMPELARTPRIPADEPTVKARMARHVWATARLWEGIVAGADDAWRGGLDVLAATPLPWSAVDTDRQALAQQLQRFADTARRTADRDSLAERTRAYGEILVTCAACHTPPAKRP